jgi:MoaA/NifB/PqqE/SkfB family radical SAM enzyme
MDIERYPFSETVKKNLLLNEREFREHKTVLKSYPIKIYVEPTQKCQLNCITCDFSRRSEKDDMALDMFERIERELFPHVAEVNFYFVGEPTLAKNIRKMIAVSGKYSYLPKIFINANYLPDDLAEMFVRLGFFINVSFDASTKGAFEKIRRESNFESIIANIRKLQKTQERIGNARFHLRLACTIGLYNIEEAPRIVRLAASMGLRDVMFGAYDSGAELEPGRSLGLDIQRTVRCFKEAKEVADREKIRFSCPAQFGASMIMPNNNWNDFPLPIDRFAPFELEGFNPFKGDCGYPWIEMGVRSNGLIVSCCQRVHEMGNYTNESFHDVWNNQRYQELRRQKSFYQCLGRECAMAVYSIWNTGTKRGAPEKTPRTAVKKKPAKRGRAGLSGGP